MYVGGDELVGYAHHDFVSELTLLQQGKGSGRACTRRSCLVCMCSAVSSAGRVGKGGRARACCVLSVCVWLCAVSFSRVK